MSGKFLVVVCFLIERNGQVLLLKRSMARDHARREWEPGSGRVEQGESALGAVFRYAKEETGLDIDVLGPIDTFHFYRGPTRKEAIWIVFHCQPIGGELTLSSEHDAAKWVPTATLAEVDGSEWMRRSVQTLLKRTPLIRGDDSN
jgi:8-oxo-dGTP diphosphatase